VTSRTPEREEWSYGATLTTAAAAASLPKTARTRLRILAALAERLNAATEPGALRVTDIMSDAGLAHGTFYRYFADQEVALEELMDGFLSFLRERQAVERPGAPGSFERVHHSIVTYCHVFRANVGLMRRLLSTEVRGGASRERFHAFNREWYVRTAEAMAAQRRARGSVASSGSGDGLRLLPSAYALGGMIDEFLVQIYLRRDPNLAFLADDVDAIAEDLTQAWCFGAYGDLGQRGRESESARRRSQATA
jgi:TetR/AcrR family transcriptional regulator, ethionamide resistance regulator